MKIHDVLVFTLLLVIGVAVALHLNDVSLPHWLRDIINRVQLATLEEDETRKEIKESPVIKSNDSPLAKQGVTTRIRETIPQYVCLKKTGQSIAEVSGPQIFKWVDEHGKTHFGDRRPQHSPSQTVAVDARTHYFNLNLHTDSKHFPPYFRDRLTARVNKAYDVLAKLITANELHQVDVNLWVFSSRTAYDSFYSRHATGVASNSQGFHNSLNNVAAALHKTDKQVLATSVHEAVHVMNAGMFGSLPRWLNEGMAEYLENIKVYGQSADVLVRGDWLRQIQRSRLSINYLLSADGDQWQDHNRSSLYGHSWALVYFLMSDQEGRNTLSKYLIATAEAPCRTLDARAYLQRNYAGGVATLERRFESWLDGDKLPHHI